MRWTLALALFGGCGFFKDGNLLDTGDDVLVTDRVPAGVCAVGWQIPATQIAGITNLVYNGVAVSASFTTQADTGGIAPMCLKADGTGVEVILVDPDGVWGTVHWEVIGPGDYGVGDPNAVISLIRRDGTVIGVWSSAQHAINQAGPGFAGSFTGAGNDGAGNFLDLALSVTAYP
jgi:hypothetical protein